MSAALGAIRRNARHLRGVARHALGPARMPAVRFVIFGRGRSGSTALVSLMTSLPGVRCEGEILHHPLLLPRAQVLARCAAAADAAAYGCKILSYQLLRVQPIRARSDFVGQLERDGFRILYLRRENLVAHAVSNIRALRYGFHAKEGQSVVREPAHIEPAELLHWLDGSRQLLGFEERALTGVPHLPLTYESDLSDPDRQQATVLRICDYLGLPSAGAARCAYRKVSPESLRDSIRNYEQIAEALAGTDYARFLQQ